MNENIVEKIIYYSKYNKYNNHNKDKEIFMACNYNRFDVLFMNGKYDGGGFISGTSGFDKIHERRMFNDQELICLINRLKEEYNLYNYFCMESELLIIFNKLDEYFDSHYLVVRIQKTRNDESDIIKHYNQVMFDNFANDLIKVPYIRDKYREYLDIKKEEIIDELYKSSILKMLSNLNEEELKEMLKTLSISRFQEIYVENIYDDEHSPRRLIPEIMKEKR